MKPESLISSDGDFKDLSLADIIDIDAVRSLMDDFSGLVPIPMAVVDLDGKVLVGESLNDTCPGYVAAPIVIGGRQMGNVVAGRFFFEGEPIDYEALRAQARTHGFDEEEYLSALDAVPRFSRETVEKAMSFFADLAHTISHLGYSNLKLARALSRRGGDIPCTLDAPAVDEQKAQTVSELARAKEEWERTFDSVPDMIAILDNCHRIVRVNAAMAKRLGVRPDECAGLACYEAVHGLSEPPEFCPHSRTMNDCLQHMEEFHDERFGGDFEISTTPVYDDRGASMGSVHVVHDITIRKRAEKERDLTLQFLSLVNTSTTKKELLAETVKFFRRESGCEAVGVRLKEGDDYPYFEVSGFPEESVLVETRLRADDGDSSIAECVCGDLIRGRFDAEKPFFTPVGSFWTNSASEFLASAAGEDWQDPTRHQCNGQGYESFLLVRLNVGSRCLGLLQLADKEKGRFSPETIAFTERLAGYLSIALGKLEAEEELKKAHDELEQRVEERTIELQQAYDKLIEETREREQVEARLRQAQKMDALGTLTGGLAHDFNNILAAIIGFTEIVKGHLPEDTRDEKSLGRVLEAGLRGRDLIKQMLSFSRKADLEKKPLLVRAVVKETMKLLRASLPTTINIKVKAENESGKILGDPVQLQQVLMNLCTNAAYAMREKGGTLDVEMSDMEITEKSPHGPPPGAYVRLVVRDSGEGIAQGDLDKIFDPFFTTKKRGEGTGLGLSVVHGIVHQLEGYIEVESQPRKGTTFYVCLPRIAEVAQVGADEEEPVPMGDERILFVDDEDLLVEMGEALLGELGYRVVSQTGSRAALARFRLDPSQFDVVITDQTMPEMTGIELAREIIAIRPDIPVILCTGYSHQIDNDAALGAGVTAFVMKPLTKRELATVIRQVLDD